MTSERTAVVMLVTQYSRSVREFSQCQRRYNIMTAEHVYAYDARYYQLQ